MVDQMRLSHRFDRAGHPYIHPIHLANPSERRLFRHELTDYPGARGTCLPKVTIARPGRRELKVRAVSRCLMYPSDVRYTDTNMYTHIYIT